MFKKLLAPIFLLIAITVYAASSYTPHFNLELPADGDENWGDGLRDNFTEIDEQMYINQQAIADHEADTTDAHMATAIGSTAGATICTDVDDVQEYLDCLEGNVGPIIGGTVMTTDTEQTVTAVKDFAATPILSALSTGLVHVDALGELTSSLLVDADVDAAAAIDRSKLANGTADHVLINDASGVVSSEAALSNTRGGLGLDASAFTGVVKASSGTFSAASLVNADVDAAAAIDRSKLATGTNNHVIINDGSGVLSSEAQLNVSRGGTGVSGASASNGQLLIGNGSGYTLGTLTGTSNQITVTNGAGSITLATPQNIGTASTPTFASVTHTASSILQDPGAGTNTWTIQAPTLGGDFTLTLPTDDGDSGQVLSTNGSGVTSWASAVTNPMNTEGDLIGGGASGAPTRVPGGAQGQVLRYDTAESANQDWQYLGGDVTTITNSDSPYTALLGSNTIVANATSGAITINLPAASSSGKTYSIVRTGASNNLVTIDPNSTETICGQTTIVMSGTVDSIDIVSDGSNWQMRNGGCERIGVAGLNCDGSSSITTNPQNNSMVSAIGNIGTGQCTMTLTTGFFSSSPDCWFESSDAEDPTGDSYQMTVASATSVTLDCTRNGGDCASWNGSFFCRGVR